MCEDVETAMNIRRVLVGTVFIAYGYYIMSTDGVRTGNRCIEDLTKVFTVQLECPAGESIHVVQEVYGDGDAATCRLKSSASCDKRHVSSQSGLIVNCNEKQSCRESTQVHPINNCNITDAAAEVKYNCIKGSMNMCSSVTTTVNGSVYLQSPGFPDSVGVNSSCVVRITGQTLQVTLVEQRMRSGMLNISGDGRQLSTNGNVNQYNRVLPGTAAEIVIVYDYHDHDGSNLWIRIDDSEILDASTTSTSTHQPSRSQSTSDPSNSDTPTTETTTRAQSTAIGNSGDVVIAVSVVCGILVVIIVVLVIYFMVVEPFRKKHNTSSYTGTPVGHGDINVYDGIQRNTSDAGNEHNYGHITSSEGPFYTNSVSGDDPYVNT